MGSEPSAPEYWHGKGRATLEIKDREVEDGRQERPGER